MDRRVWSWRRIRWRAAKVLTDFAKENDQRPAVKGGVFDGKPIDEAQVKKLASMPSREQMLAELGAGLQAPMAVFARRAERPAVQCSPVRSKRCAAQREGARQCLKVGQRPTKLLTDRSIV